ncbi:MAG: O-antigen ligase family protein [Clostridia bacterium]|nr:O-antigen ligase family protein [Clostridia bacterium]
MKNKLITIILTLVVILSSIAVLPQNEIMTSAMLKNIIILFCSLLLIILILTNYQKLKFDNKDLLLLTFLLLVITSTFMSTDIHKSIYGEGSRYEGLLMFISYACIYLASKKFFEYKKISIFFNVMFYTSLFIGIIGFFQNYLNIPNTIFTLVPKATFGNQNFFGSYISIVLPISMSIYILYNSNKALVLSNIMFFNMLSCGTRSAWIAFTVVSFLGIIYLVKIKNKVFLKRCILLIICFILIFLFIYNGIGNYIFSHTLFSGTSSYNLKERFKVIGNDLDLISKNGLSNKLGSSRIEIWKMTLKVVEKYPLLGYGTDNLQLGLIFSCPDDVINYINAHHGIPDKAHNEYLHIAATLGIPALLVYLIFLALIVLPKLKNMDKDKKSLIFSLAILSYLAQAFFNISTIGVSPLFWMLLGLSDNENIERSIIKYEQDQEKNI